MKFQKFPFKIEKQYRLKGWDYSNTGYYFVTICTKDRIGYFGQIKNQIFIPNNIGLIAKKYWLEIPKHFENITLDSFTIMPNHIHGIVILKSNDPSSVGTHHDAFLQNNKFKYLACKSTQMISLSIKLFKSSIKKSCNQHNLKFFWQPRFHDRIIRNEKEYWAIKQYIKDNPKNWERDKENKLMYY